MYKLDDLQKKKVANLKEIASKLNLKKFEKLNKTDLIYKILDEQATTSSKETKIPPKKKERFIQKTTTIKSNKKKPVSNQKSESEEDNQKNKSYMSK